MAGSGLTGGRAVHLPGPQWFDQRGPAAADGFHLRILTSLGRVRKLEQRELQQITERG